MSDIGVVIYAYKSKTVKNVINNLIKNQSGKNNITVLLFDQHPLDREENFVNEFPVDYVHVFWDHQNSPIKRKYLRAKLINSDYLMFISDQVLLYENWDSDLVSYTKSNMIISGEGITKLQNKNLFYFDKIKEPTEDFTLSNFIDRKFIFTTTKTFLDLHIPFYLKYHGEEEHLSLDCFTKNIPIYSVPTNFYSLTGINTIEELYVPFSLNHNYNELLELLKSGKNKFATMSNRQISVKDFWEYHNFNIDNIHYLPFTKNDVSYEPNNLNFNKVDARRFIDRTRVID